MYKLVLMSSVSRMQLKLNERNSFGGKMEKDIKSKRIALHRVRMNTEADNSEELFFRYCTESRDSEGQGSGMPAQGCF